MAQCEVLLIDDIGYVQQSREEMEVLFTLLADRYERGTVMLTSFLLSILAATLGFLPGAPA